MPPRPGTWGFNLNLNRRGLLGCEAESAPRSMLHAAWDCAAGNSADCVNFRGDAAVGCDPGTRLLQDSPQTDCYST